MQSVGGRRFLLIVLIIVFGIVHTQWLDNDQTLTVEALVLHCSVCRSEYLCRLHFSQIVGQAGTYQKNE